VSAARPDRAALLVAIAIAAAIFAVSFGFAADAERGGPTATSHRAPRHSPAPPRVALEPAPDLRVRASLLAPRRAPARPVSRHIAPRPAPVAPAPSTDVPAPPVGPSAPVGGASPVGASPPVGATPPATSPPPAPVPGPARPAPKPRPQPAAKPRPPDFDDSGPSAPGKGRPDSR
jgi:hypothetical protein